jgi:hypothetical protein
LASEWLKKFWDLIKGSDMPKYFEARLKYDNIFPIIDPSKDLKINNFYFEIHIEEMWLNRNRKWYLTYDPMVTIGSEFIYDKKNQSVPGVIGPSMLKKYQITDTPAGMIYSHIRIGGPNPYKGGSLALATVLCKNKKQNYVEEVLNLIQRTNEVFPISSMLGTYIQMANTIREGIELILKLGDGSPVLGRFSDYSLPEHAGCYVITNIPSDQSINKDKLWLIDNKLYYGDIDKEKPDDRDRFYNVFDDCDYLVFSISLRMSRGIYETLSFYPFYQEVVNEVDQSDQWTDVQNKLISLLQALNKSPDLSDTEKKSLRKKYVKEIKDQWIEKKKIMQEPTRLRTSKIRSIEDSIKVVLSTTSM